MPEGEGVREGILRGMYLLEEVPEGMGEEAPRVHLFGSGAILREALRARELLRERGVGATVWSVTSYVEMRREALGTERWNRLHPEEEARVAWVTEQLGDRPWPVVAALAELARRGRLPRDDVSRALRDHQLPTDSVDPAHA